MSLPESKDMSFKLLIDLIHKQTGLDFRNGRQELAVDKLLPLIADRGLNSFLDYYYLLKYGEDAQGEWRRVESALAVNETYFWREYDQIDAAVKLLIPQIMEMHPNRPVRIWHAACATGEEPYTMAISLLENQPLIKGKVEIVATDSNSEAIALARAGAFGERSFRKIPNYILANYFKVQDSARYRISDEVRGMVQFFHLNLMNQAGMEEMKDFDLIFCRNVFIYFSRLAVGQVVQNFYNSLRDPGYLFVAAAESLLRITTSFDLQEVGKAFVYKKE
jgi:chemotaxis protein methyltransferase CheR